MLCYRGSVLQSCQILSFLGKTILHVCGHTQFHWLCCVIQSNILTFITFLLIYFLLFAFLSPLCVSSRGLLSCDRVQCPRNFLLLMWLLVLVVHPSMGPFIFRDFGFPSPILVPDLVLCTECILPCKNSRLWHSCCIKWYFGYPVRWVPYIWIIVLLNIFMYSRS